MHSNFIVFALVISSIIRVFSQSISVDAEKLLQPISMIGADMERSSSFVQKASNTDEILTWVFGDIAFQVCRVQYDKNQEMEEGVHNWDFYKDQLATMKKIKEINPDIEFFATMRSDYNGFNQGDTNNLPVWIYNRATKEFEKEKYGVFLGEYVEYMYNQGVPIRYLSTAKEWMQVVTAYKSRDIINAMKDYLEKKNIPMPLMVEPGSWSISQGISFIKTVKTLGTENLYYGFASHDYQNEGEKWVDLVNEAKTINKPVWDDETNAGGGGPTYGVEVAISKPIGSYIKKCEAYKSGLQGEVLFELWTRGIDRETRCIYFKKGEPGVRYRGYSYTGICPISRKS